MTTFRLLAATAIALAVPLSAQPTATFDPARLREHTRVMGDNSFEGRGARNCRRNQDRRLHQQAARRRRRPAGRRHAPTASGMDPGRPAAAVRSGPPTRSSASISPAGRRRSPRASRSPPAPRPTATRPSTSTTRELVFVGYGVKAPERNWDDFKGVDARGKILVVLVNDPDFEGGEGDFGGKAMTYYGRWTYKYEEGARQGRQRRPGDPRDRPGLLRLGDGQELQHQRDVRHRPPEPGGRASRARRLDPARPRRAAVRRLRHQLRGAEGGGQAPRLQAGGAEGHPRRSTATRRPRWSLRTTSSACCPARRGPTRR